MNRRMKLLLAPFCVAGLFAGDISFVVAGLRVMPDPANLEANYRKLDQFTRQAAAKGAQVVVTPESFLDGYMANSNRKPLPTLEEYRAKAKTAGGPVLARAQGLARELKIFLVVGFPEVSQDVIHNAVVVISPEGKVVHRYYKAHCGGANEPYNTDGTEFPVLDTPLGRWGTLICLDRRLPEPARILAIKGAKVLLLPSYGTSNEMNDALVRTRAFENSVFLAFVHPKRCLIIDPAGNVLAQDSGDRDQIVSAKITLDAGQKLGAIRYRRPEIYGEILGRSGSH